METKREFICVQAGAEKIGRSSGSKDHRHCSSRPIYAVVFKATVKNLLGPAPKENRCSFGEDLGLFPLQALAKKFAGGSAHKDRPSFLPSEFARLFKAAGERLLQQYVNLQIKKLTLLVRKSVETPNWLKVRLRFDVCCGKDPCNVYKCENSRAENESADRKCHCSRI